MNLKKAKTLVTKITNCIREINLWQAKAIRIFLGMASPALENCFTQMSSMLQGLHIAFIIQVGSIQEVDGRQSPCYW